MSNRRRIVKTYKQKQEESATEIEVPEIIHEQLWSLSEWMEANWRPVVAGIAIVTVVWGGIGLFQLLTARGARSTAAANAPVYAAMAKPVYAPPATLQGEDPNKPLGTSFTTAKERAEAVVAAAAGLEGDEKVLAEVVVGAAKGTLGDRAAQLAAIDAAIAAAGDAPNAQALLAQRATVLTAMGKGADAGEAWQKVAAGANTSALKGMALVRAGDAINPKLNKDAAGDAAKAKAAYQGAIAAVAVAGKAPSEGHAGFLHLEATAKLGQLE